ncbi:MAG TPA: M4 family metallopeptidase [Candidatus Competibacteraceae bacterium]|nr:M4 family metallopeptidase [Candidatus Competibacteraceae bacterium]
MCQSTNHRHSIFCILPPHILQAIANHGTPQQRAMALQTLGTDHTVRSLRAMALQAVPAARRHPRISAVTEAQKHRTIYNAQHTETLPGTVVRTEGAAPSDDPAVDEAYDGLGATFDFYWEIFERNSIDDEGMPLDATVHFGQGYDNAFFDGQRMVFGDGDGDLFTRFTISVDVIGHELTHGVTQDEAGLTYFGQPGALNESMSDVFGSLIKQFALKQTADKADWLIGAGLFTTKVQGVALRSMKAPGTAYNDPVLGKDPQPAHMKDFVNTSQDNGGVHINSGIPNHAFYLVATQLGGHAWEKAGPIWYETLRDPRLRSNSSFSTFARLTANVARRLYGSNGTEEKAVRESWKQVGIVIK